MASSTRSKREEKKDRPVGTFSSGLLEVSVWENEFETDEGQKVGYAISFQRSYRNDKDEWKKTQTLRPTDALIVAELLRQAWAWIAETKKDGKD